MNERLFIDFAHALKTRATCSALVTACVVAIGASQAANAAEGGWRNFFRGGDEQEANAESQTESQLLLNDPLAAQPSETEATDERMITSPFGHVTWPEIKLPKFEFRPPWKSADNGQPGWFATPLAKARSMSQNAVHRTRTAWNGAVDRMKFALPGRNEGTLESGPQVAQNKKPGFWRRIFAPAGSEATVEDGVVDMMAQEPTNPTR